MCELFGLRAFHSSHRFNVGDFFCVWYQNIRSTQIIIFEPRFQHRSLTAYRIIFRSSLDGFFYFFFHLHRVQDWIHQLCKIHFMHEKKSIAHRHQLLGRRRMEKSFLCMLHNRYHNLIPGSPPPPSPEFVESAKTYNFLLRLKIQNIFLLSPCSLVRVSDKWFLLERQHFVYSSFLLSPHHPMRKSCIPFSRKVGRAREKALPILYGI